MAKIENYLIQMLPRKDRLDLLAICKPVALDISTILCEPGMPTRFVYFPTEGFISLVARSDESPGVEVGMIGHEGMLGAQLVLGVITAPLRALVQGQGMALRASTSTFRSVLANSPALQQGLDRYIYVLMAQMATSVACLRSHEIAPRLARWLLMTQDRADSDSFRVTHEFLAYMLGVRRVGVTRAAGLLQQDGLIKYSRGNITVLDRRGLEAEACGCYAIDQQIYATLM